MPKPPPTSNTRTRTSVLASPGSAATRPSRTALGIWLDKVTIQRPASSPWPGAASTVRGSIEAGASR